VEVMTAELPAPGTVSEWTLATADDFLQRAGEERPFVVRGLAGHWPLVQAGLASLDQALELVAQQAGPETAEVMIGPAQEAGRFFYNDDLAGFNFQRQRMPVGEVSRQILRCGGNPVAPAIYAGAVETQRFWPGFDASHRLPLVPSEITEGSRIWLGTRAEVATHFDLSANLAVVAAGRRQFLLFPPEVTADLYVGPLNHTIAGQPVSMVDPLRADLEKYPRFAQAWASALRVELAPGDALYMPPLWWHHVTSLDRANILVNYWHNDVAQGGPFLAFIHALWAVRDLSPEQRKGWQAWFDHFVFADAAAAASDHLPMTARGVNGPASPARSEMVRRFLIQVLSGG
jgi:Cupin-like domain